MRIYICPLITKFLRIRALYNLFLPQQGGGTEIIAMEINVKNLQEKLDFLLDKYSVNTSAKLISAETAEIGGKTAPLLPWRNERRFTELKNLTVDGTINGISVMRTLRIVPKTESLEKNIARELDLCEYILSDKISEIMTFKNGSAVNIAAKLSGGIVCTVEVAATLGPGTAPIDKHEIIAQQGVACDRVVDTQVPQSSIYVFTDKKDADTYTDVDFELFGLSVDEAAIVRQVFEAAKNPALADDLNRSKERLDTLLKLSEQSGTEAENIKVEG